MRCFAIAQHDELLLMNPNYLITKIQQAYYNNTWILVLAADVCAGREFQLGGIGKTPYSKRVNRVDSHSRFLFE